MLSNILLILSLAANIADLAAVFMLFKKNTKTAVSVDSELQSIINTRKQIELLQAKFKESLEQIISKNNVMIESTSNNLIKYYQDTITTLTLNYNQNSEKLMQVLNEELRKKVTELSNLNLKELAESKNVVSTEVKKANAVMQAQVDKYT